jgi:hypothetical protein
MTLEAIKGDVTINELASQFGVHPELVTPVPWAPAMRLSVDDRDRTRLGQLSVPCRGHQGVVRPSIALVNLTKLSTHYVYIKRPLGWGI